MFKNAIVRRPGKSMTGGITSAPELGAPDWELALRQHDVYIKALEACGVAVEVLPALEDFPDSCFVEDTAVLTPRCAILCNPGAASRNAETGHIAPAIRGYYMEEQMEATTAPGTVDGGDVMMVGEHFYIGLSARTNKEGAAQFIAALEKHGHTGTAVPFKEMLHLKSGLAYLENNNLLVSGEFIGSPLFEKFNCVAIDADEGYAANSVWMNGTVLMPAGYPKALAKVKALGYPVVEVDTSEYRKLDGGLSCLSLRF